MTRNQKPQRRLGMVDAILTSRTLSAMAKLIGMVRLTTKALNQKAYNSKAKCTAACTQSSLNCLSLTSRSFDRWREWTARLFILWAERSLGKAFTRDTDYSFQVDL